MPKISISASKIMSFYSMLSSDFSILKCQVEDSKLKSSSKVFELKKSCLSSLNDSKLKFCQFEKKNTENSNDFAGFNRDDRAYRDH